MIDYMKSEFYRSFHNRSLKICVVIFMILAALMVIILAALRRDPTFPYGNTEYYLSSIYTSMDALIYVVLVIVGYTDNNEYKNHTIKHSIAVGIPRSTIYIGRMIVQAIICVVVYLILNLEMISFAYTFLEHSHEGEFEMMIRAGVSCFPIFLGCVALFQCILMNVESPWGIGILSIGLVSIIPGILSIFSMKFPLLGKVCYWFYASLASANFDEKTKVFHYTWDTIQGVRNCYLAGVVGIIAFTVIGIACYKRKEVK